MCIINKKNSRVSFHWYKTAYSTLKSKSVARDFFTKLYDNYKINDLSITNYDLIIDEFINNAEEKRKKLFKKYENELKIINDTHLENIITEIKNIVTDYYINVNAPYYYALYLTEHVLVKAATAATAAKKKSFAAKLVSLNNNIESNFIDKLADINIEFKYYIFSVRIIWSNPTKWGIDIIF